MKSIVMSCIILLCCLGGIAQNVNIIPQPLTILETEGAFTIRSGTIIVADAVGTDNAKYLQDLFAPCVDLQIKKRGKKGIVLKQNKKLFDELGEEGYKLRVGEDAVVIESGTQEGIFYGIQTIRQMVLSELTAASSSLTVPAVEITDLPRFSWRAFMLDEARHFQGADFVKRMLDEMAFLKMNVFHWHLTDDAGWRIEIKKYPKLTEVGAFRKNTQVGPKKWKSDLLSGEPHSGYYTQEQIKEIIDYASARHITIVPEIEMPGHASAAIASYPWLGVVGELTEVPYRFGKLPDSYNVADPRVYQFFEDVLSEVFALFPGETVHIGGDEVDFETWKESADIQKFMQENELQSPADVQIMFTNKISNYIEKKRHRMMGWNEIMGKNVHDWQDDNDFNVKETLADNAIVHFWKGTLDLVKDAVTSGYEIVNSYHVYTYLDYNYKSISLEKAYSFDPIPEGLDEQHHKKILGSGCQMWTEWTPANKDVERQVFPRLAAYAEVGWTVQSRKDYSLFRQNLEPMLKQWEKTGIAVGEGFE